MCWILSLHEEKIREQLMKDVMAEAINKGGHRQRTLTLASDYTATDVTPEPVCTDPM
jgi:hypothetical protein